jgi:hypothetical protein
MLAYECDTCEATCEEYTLPVVQSEYCPATMTLELGEIKRILLAEIDPVTKGPKNGPTDWTDVDDWDTAISNSGAGAVRSLHGIGDLAEPEGKTLVVHDAQEINVEDKYTLVFDVMDTNTTNYAAARSMSGCKGQYKLWYETRGNFLYGGQDAITVNILRVTKPQERGDGYSVIKIYMKWISKCLPERVVSPFLEAVTP